MMPDLGFSRPAPWGLAISFLLVGIISTGRAQAPASPGTPPDAPAASPATTAPAAAPAAAPSGMRIGAIDVERTFEKYEKARFIRHQILDDVKRKNDDLKRRMDEMQTRVQELQKLDPESADFRQREADVRRLKSEYEATRELHQSDLARREAELLASIYKDVQSMTDRVARFQKLQFVVKVTNSLPTGSDPNTVMAAMSHSVVYYDPTLDITNHVIYYLNDEYKKQGGTIVPPDAPVDNAATTTGATAPASSGPVSASAATAPPTEPAAAPRQQATAPAARTPR
jgi:outer membrane protein